MKYILKALLSESSSVSSMRVMSLLCCMAGISIALIGLLKANPDYVGLSALCGTFLGIAFTGKAVQKQVELSNKKAVDDK